MILKYILCAAAAYLLGSISTGVLLSRRLFHDDVRKHGSGGTGATNMLRTYRLKAALLTFAGDAAKAALADLENLESLTESTYPLRGFGRETSGLMVLFCLILMAYAVIKVFFSNLKRGGILLIQIAVGSLYMLSVPRGYGDGFIQWCKQVIGLCLTAFLQATILVAGLMVFKDHALLGLGLMLSAGEIPRIAGAFGLDTTTRASISSAVYTAQTAVNMARTVVAAAK